MGTQTSFVHFNWTLRVRERFVRSEYKYANVNRIARGSGAGRRWNNGPC